MFRLRDRNSIDERVPRRRVSNENLLIFSGVDQQVDLFGKKVGDFADEVARRMLTIAWRRAAPRMSREAPNVAAMSTIVCEAESLTA